MNKINKKGFTIIELLVVVAIIGILSTISVVAFNVARMRNRDTKRLADMKQISTGLDLYFNDNGLYPVGNDVTLGVGSYGRLCSTGFTTVTDNCSNIYIGAVPANPGPNAGTDYKYTRGASPYTTYDITFTLELKVGKLNSGLRTQNPEGIK